MNQLLDTLKQAIKQSTPARPTSMIKKTPASQQISSLAWEILDQSVYQRIIEIFNRVIEYTRAQKQMHPTISPYDMFHFHMLVNKQNQIELLFHLYEYASNYYDPTHHSTLRVSAEHMRNRNVVYNTHTDQFRFAYNYEQGQLFTVEAEQLGTWIGDLYLGDLNQGNGKAHIFFLSTYLAK
jgi:hypothetical protein